MPERYCLQRPTLTGCLLALALLAPAAAAQNTGRLQGRAVDAETQRPLEGVRVVLSGTRLAAETDDGGAFTLLGVPAGRYLVRFSLEGYAEQLVHDVDVVDAGLARLDVALAEGLGEEPEQGYERPLVAPHEPGARRVVTADEIARLAVRDVAAVASLLPGVVRPEGDGALFVRGGEAGEVQRFVDGRRVDVLPPLPVVALQEVQLFSGLVPAQYGDATAGVLSVTTRHDAARLFGSVEGLTSRGLGGYGASELSGAFGGPLVPGRLSFFAAARFDERPPVGARSTGFPALDDAARTFVNANPQVLSIVDERTGARAFVPLPGDVPPGTRAADVLPQLQVPDGWRVESFVPSFAGNTYTAERFTREAAPPGDPQHDLYVTGDLTLTLGDGMRLRTGGDVERRRGREFSLLHALYAPDRYRHDAADAWRLSGTWSHHLTPTTFYQLQADFRDARRVLSHPGFSTDVREALFYGDIDHPANEGARRYVSFVPSEGVYVPAYQDGFLPVAADIQNTWYAPGAGPVGGYDRQHVRRFAFRADASLRRGIHQVDLGAAYEQETRRRYELFGALGLAVYQDDGAVEGGLAVDDYEALTFDVLNAQVYYYGYNYLGTEAVDDQDVEAFTAGTNYNVAPFRPLYAAGYVQDRFEVGRVAVHAGLRVELYDHNRLTLYDPYSLFPIVRAGDLDSVPGGVGDDFAVYYSAFGDIVGYRDRAGRFYDAEGRDARPLDIRNAGSPRPRTDATGAEIRRITPDVFRDAPVSLGVQPRLGVTVALTEHTLGYTTFSMLAQRAELEPVETIQQWAQATVQSSRHVPANVTPLRSTAFEVGARHALDDRLAVQLTAFYRRHTNRTALRIQQNVFPGNYVFYDDTDTGTANGVELSLELRRTRNVSLHAAYTLSSARGTGNDAATTAQVVWRQETNPFYPRFVSPMGYDQRHRLNVLLDYRLGDDEGPRLLGFHPLSNTGVNVVGQFGSGFPYTRRNDVDALWRDVDGFLEGGINAARMPASARVDVRVDRRFDVGPAGLTAFVWVQNVLDTDNVVAVYPMTGDPAVDGWLSSPAGRDYVGSLQQVHGPQGAGSFVDHYEMRARTPFHYGLPRLLHVGLRLGF